MIVYSETVVWSAPAELAGEAPYQLVLVDDNGARTMGRVRGERLKIGDNVILDAVEHGVHFFRKTA